MPDIADILATQYGLKQAPSPEQVQQWATITEQLISSGVANDQAGMDAAKEAFSGLF